MQQLRTVSARAARRWAACVVKICAGDQRDSGRNVPQRDKRRSDRGQALRDNNNRAKIKRAIELNRKGPLRSDLVINQMLRLVLGSDLASSTLYRLLRIHGATRKRLGLQKEKVRCRWTRDTPNTLWMGDISHGPIVLCDGQPKRTHLSAWIEMHSRYVVEARFYFRENLDILIDSLLRAWANRPTLKRSE